MADKSNWLEGPQVPGQFDDPDNLSSYPGQNLGLNQSGEGSQASLLRRVGGILIDWVVSMFLTAAVYPFAGPSDEQLEQFGDPFIAWQSFTATWTLLIFLVVGTVSVWLFGRTPGQAMLGMGVARVDVPGTRVGLWRSFLRSFLTLLLLPPASPDSDLRGGHVTACGGACNRGADEAKPTFRPPRMRGAPGTAAGTRAPLDQSRWGCAGTGAATSVRPRAAGR